jgi:hypothetical protein
MSFEGARRRLRFGKDIEAVWWVCSFKTKPVESNPTRAAVVMIAKASEAFLGVGFDIMGKHSFYRIRGTNSDAIE